MASGPGAVRRFLYRLPLLIERPGGLLVEVTDVKGGIQTLVRVTIEIEGGDKPACVIDSLSRWLV